MWTQIPAAPAVGSQWVPSRQDSGRACPELTTTIIPVVNMGYMVVVRTDVPLPLYLEGVWDYIQKQHRLKSISPVPPVVCPRAISHPYLSMDLYVCTYS